MAHGSAATRDDDLERRTMRKVSRRILPFVMLLYLVAFLDRVNVGFAALTMNRDIGLSPAAFGLGAAMFFVGYVSFEVPSNIILHRVGARFWIARVMVTWGLVSGAMALVAGPRSFFLLRLLLGLAEAGFFPGVILYLGYWFPAARRAAVTASFMAAAPIAGFVGGPVSGALLRLDGVGGLHGWQWLFVIEAVPAVALGIATWFLLTDRPERARWLEPVERDWLSSVMAAERAGTDPVEHGRGTLAALRDQRVLLLAIAYFGTSAGLYTIGIWAPTLIARFGYSVGQVGLLSAVPNLAAIIGMVLWSLRSDRRGERIGHAASACLMAAMGAVAAAHANGSALVVLLGLTLTAMGVNAAKPVLWTIPPRFLAGGAAAAGIGLVNALGTVRGAAGSYVIGRTMSAGGPGRGLDMVGAALVCSALVVLLLGRVLAGGRERENGR